MPDSRIERKNDRFQTGDGRKFASKKPVPMRCLADRNRDKRIERRREKDSIFDKIAVRMAKCPPGAPNWIPKLS